MFYKLEVRGADKAYAREPIKIVFKVKVGAILA
jgi:hypothetical protein